MNAPLFAPPAHVFVGVPAREPLELETTEALFALREGLGAAGVGFTLAIEQVSGLVLARNLLAGRFRAHPEATHLLCLDRDVSGFTTDDVLRMIASDRPLIGAPLPSRVLSSSWIERIDKARANGIDRERLHHYRSDLLFQTEAGAWEIRGDAIRVAWMGTGFLLIRRDALEAVIAHLEGLAKDGQAAPPTSEVPGWGQVVSVFDYVVDGAGRYYGEDVGFCLRAKSAGIATWADTKAALWHIGREIWTAPPLEESLGIARARARAEAVAVLRAERSESTTSPDGFEGSTREP